MGRAPQSARPNLRTNQGGQIGGLGYANGGKPGRGGAPDAGFGIVKCNSCFHSQTRANFELRSGVRLMAMYIFAKN